VVDDVNDPQALLQHAQRLEKAGRLAEAEAAYMQLLSRWPDLTNTWYNLALLQRRAGRFDAALASYQQALDRGISEPEQVHLNRGVIYADCLRQDEAAERELHAALALNPRYVPALLNLANLREDFGRRAEALELYEKILALAPRHHEALARTDLRIRKLPPRSAQVSRSRSARAWTAPARTTWHSEPMKLRTDSAVRARRASHTTAACTSASSINSSPALRRARSRHRRVRSSSAGCSAPARR
jgi:tetratricopeptide (TPR) repeat protein